MNSSFADNKYADALHQIESNTAKTLESTYKMKLCGSGGGAMFGIDMVALSFEIKRLITIEEARVILVASVQQYLENINASKTIRPYLVEYPFTPRGVTLHFYVRSSREKGDKEHIDGFSVYCVGTNKIPTVFYESRDEQDKMKDVLVETFEEAKERVNGSKKSDV